MGLTKAFLHIFLVSHYKKNLKLPYQSLLEFHLYILHKYTLID